MKEERLIKKAIKNNRSAQNALYEMYKRYWFMICLRYVQNYDNAQDVLQEGLVKIFLKLKRFDSSKGSFKSWSSKIIVNESLIFLRKQKNQVFVEINEEVFDIGEAQESENYSTSKALLEMIQKLPVGYRTVFNLYVMEGYSHAEIAEILEISIGSSKSQLFKAKKMLKRNLEMLLLEKV